MNSRAPIPLTDASALPQNPAEDRRVRMPEPLPVKLVTVDDARLAAAHGLEVELDGFYVKMLGFERDASAEPITYHAENFRIIFDGVEPPVDREDMRALGIEVRSLAAAEQKLIDAEIDYLRQKSLTPGHDSLLLRDPAGNWIELFEASAIR